MLIAMRCPTMRRHVTATQRKKFNQQSWKDLSSSFFSTTGLYNRPNIFPNPSPNPQVIKQKRPRQAPTGLDSRSVLPAIYCLPTNQKWPFPFWTNQSAETGGATSYAPLLWPLLSPATFLEKCKKTCLNESAVGCNDALQRVGQLAFSTPSQPD